MIPWIPGTAGSISPHSLRVTALSPSTSCLLPVQAPPTTPPTRAFQTTGWGVREGKPGATAWDPTSQRLGFALDQLLRGHDLHVSWRGGCSLPVRDRGRRRGQHRDDRRLGERPGISFPLAGWVPEVVPCGRTGAPRSPRRGTDLGACTHTHTHTHPRTHVSSSGTWLRRLQCPVGPGRCHSCSVGRCC